VPSAIAGFDELKHHRILVVGATGFIGRALIEHLLDLGAPGVSVFARSATKTIDWQRRGVNVILGDLTDAATLGNAVRGMDLVINLAYDFTAGRAANETAFANLLDAVVDAEPKRFLHVSSVVVYEGWPDQDVTEDSPLSQNGSDYVAAKISAEKSIATRVDRSKTTWVILQPTIVYGAGSWLWTDVIVDKMLAGKIAVTAGGRGLCNAVHVIDVVQGLLLAATRPVSGEQKFILSANEAVPWKQFLEAYEVMIGKSCIVYLESSHDLKDEAAGAANSSAREEPVKRRESALHALWRALDRRLSTRFKIRAKAALLRLTQRTNVPVFYPGPGDARLYAARGRCLIDKARSELGYNPTLDLAKGMALTEEYVRAKYLSRV